ncbi:hypothetical protein BJF78_17625 [Pseudonocardia sp. CNS-139]|nr:hypothetical protein BJF78_17625 [Pseudonocardia sp. CNS-139]
MSSGVHADVWAAEQGGVTVNPFDQLDATLEPEVTRGRRPGRHRVVTVNSGNRPGGVQIDYSDRDGELEFDPPQAGGTLAPGESVTNEVRVNGPRSWFGRTRSLPFTARVSPIGNGPPGPGRMPIVLNGTRRQVPVFPWWIPTVALALVGLAIALYAVIPTTLVPSVRDQPQAQALATLTAAGYVATAVPRATRPCRRASRSAPRPARTRRCGAARGSRSSCRSGSARSARCRSRTWSA